MLKSALIMVLGMLCIPLGDAAGKLLSNVHGIEPFFIAWSRFFLGACMFMLLMAGKNLNLKLLLDWRIWLRGSLITGGILSILTALQTEPISNVFAAFFIGPIVSYFGSALFLGEAITKSRTVLLFIGFCGVLLVVKPGIDMSPGMGFAFLAGVFYGSFLISSKWLAERASSRQLLLSQLLVGTILLMPVGVPSIPELGVESSLLVLLSAGASAIGNLLLIIANQREDASKLAPLIYTQLLAATVYGIFIFNTYPDKWSLLGLGIICFSGFAAFFISRERKSSKIRAFTRS